jgi:hypothetical protein
MSESRLTAQSSISNLSRTRHRKSELSMTWRGQIGTRDEAKEQECVTVVDLHVHCQGHVVGDSVGRNTIAAIELDFNGIITRLHRCTDTPYYSVFEQHVRDKEMVSDVKRKCNDLVREAEAQDTELEKMAKEVNDATQRYTERNDEITKLKDRIAVLEKRQHQRVKEKDEIADSDAQDGSPLDDSTVLTNLGYNASPTVAKRKKSLPEKEVFHDDEHDRMSDRANGTQAGRRKVAKRVSFAADTKPGDGSNHADINKNISPDVHGSVGRTTRPRSGRR